MKNRRILDEKKIPEAFEDTEQITIKIHLINKNISSRNIIKYC